jgi:peptidoglycan/xylan/chitin deacetylase (PgdA/CDA1 family)
MEVLGKNYRTIPLKYVTQFLTSDSVKSRAIVVTFDDGYADNLHEAKPLLDRFEHPATVFVTAGQIDSATEFWWDELERIFLQPGHLPSTLQLQINGNTYQWSLGDDAKYDPRRFNQLRQWNSETKGLPSSRHKVYVEISDLLRPLVNSVRRAVIGDLVKWADVETWARPTHRSLTRQEVTELSKGDLLEIGSHTLTHPQLACHAANIQQSEIAESKTHLEKVLGREVTSFAYPYGGRLDYSTDTVDLVRAANYNLACANFPDFVFSDSDTFQLPRVLIRNIDGKAFQRLLNMWIDV